VQAEFNRLWKLASEIETPSDSLTRENCLDLYGIAQIVKDGVIVEIGSWMGRSSVFLGANAPVNGNTVYCIDPWLEKFSKDVECVSGLGMFEKWRQNVKRCGCGEDVKPIMGASSEVGKDWSEDKMIDLLFLDGMHNYRDDSYEFSDEEVRTLEIEGWKIKGVFYPASELKKINMPEFGVKVDFDIWSPFIKEGGSIAFHDIHVGWPAVARVWEEEIKSKPHVWSIQSERNNLGIAKKLV
jgi:hypothetical protein